MTFLFQANRDLRKFLLPECLLRSARLGSQSARMRNAAAGFRGVPGGS